MKNDGRGKRRGVLFFCRGAEPVRPRRLRGRRNEGRPAGGMTSFGTGMPLEWVPLKRWAN